MNIAQVKVLIELLEDISFSHITIYIIINYKMSNRKDINQKTDFNQWSISYLTEIFQCCRCKKRNTVVLSSNSNEERKINFQNCLYCGNPNYIK